MPALHVVLDGELRAAPHDGDRGPSTFGPRQAFGVLEVLAHRPVAAPVIAATETRTYELAAHDLAEVLEDNFGLLSTARRGIARGLLAARARGPASRAPVAVAATAGLGLVERLLLLRQHLPFGSLPALAALAQTARELAVPAGATVCGAGEHPGVLIVLAGAVRDHRAATEVVVPNDAIGVYDTLAEQPCPAPLEAITDVRVLRLSTPVLFDVMEDHTELALGTLAMLAGKLLDAHVADDAN